MHTDRHRCEKRPTLFPFLTPVYGEVTGWGSKGLRIFLNPRLSVFIRGFHRTDRAKPSHASQVQVRPVAPTAALPLQFILTGMLCLLGGVAWLAVEPTLLTSYHYNQSIIALTHLVVLGWICSAVMGAMYQLVPVALETTLYSTRLARWQFVIHVLGFAGMVWMFRVWNLKQVGHFGSALALGVGLFVFNMARTLRRTPKWNVVATAITSSLVWFSLTIVAGLSIAASKCTYESANQLAVGSTLGAMLRGLRSVATFVSHFDAINAMHAHAHLGVIGLFTVMIVGVSYKLVPMFTLSEIQSSRRAITSLLLINAGLAGSVTCILLRSPLKFFFALTVIAGLAVYGWELIAIVRARQRAALDWGVKSFLTAAAILAPLCLLGAVLSWPRLPFNVFTGQLENLYGFLGLLGFVSLAIIGMLQKIVPFLVWLSAYGRHVGRAQVPALVELYSGRVQAGIYWCWLAGLTVASAGILSQSALLVRLGAISLVAGVLLLTANTAKTLRHIFRPALNPQPTQALFNGVRPSSGAATNLADGLSDTPVHRGALVIAAPEDGRTPH